LEVNDDEENQYCTQDVAQVWQGISEEGILDGTESVLSDNGSDKEFNEGSFVLFHTGVSVDLV
jgi:hypothetical protein